MYQLPSDSISLQVPRGDRWQLLFQLESLDIPVSCQADGSLQVTIQSPLAAIQLRSVLWREQAPRWEQVNWLEQCWASC